MIEIFYLKKEKVVFREHDNTAGTLKFWKSIPKSSTRWVRVLDPSQKELELLSQLSGVPLQELEDIKEEEERPSVFATKYIEIVYSAVHKEQDDIVTIPITIYITGTILLTLERKKNRVLSQLSRMLKLDKRRFMLRGNAGDAAAYLIDKINDDFLRTIDNISIGLDVFKERLQIRPKNVEAIYDASLTLSHFNRAILANIEVLNTLRKTYKVLTVDNRSQFRELYNDVLQIRDSERIQREAISTLFNMQSVISSMRLNNFMRRITIFAAIIALPTMIASIYGMNIANLPFAGSQYGFYILLVMMLGSVIISLLLVSKIFSQ